MRAIRALFWWLIAPIALAGLIAAWLVPATWWFEPGEIVVRSAPAGHDPIVSVQRTSKREFDGRFTVSVWREPPEATPSCSGSGHVHYRGGLTAPYEMPLSEWANDSRCAGLQAGTYYAKACWTVLQPFRGIVPDKTACTQTRIFTMTEDQP